MEVKKVPKYVCMSKCKNKYRMGKEGNVDSTVRADNVYV